jgi:Cu-Zn family superoxide dismutase
MIFKRQFGRWLAVAAIAAMTAAQAACVFGVGPEGADTPVVIKETVVVVQTATPAVEEVGALAKLKNVAGEQKGEVKLSQEKDGRVLVRVNVLGLPPGFHGFHVHAVGKCEPDFAAAGGHLNPSGAGHPGHAADMPVLLVNADGTGEARFKTDRYTVEGLFDADGSALIIHEKADNYANIPTLYAPAPDADTTLKTGDAGGRIACGVIAR